MRCRLVSVVNRSVLVQSFNSYRLLPQSYFDNMGNYTNKKYVKYTYIAVEFRNASDVLTRKDQERQADQTLVLNIFDPKTIRIKFICLLF